MKREVKFRAWKDGNFTYSSPLIKDSSDSDIYDLREFFDLISDDSLLMQFTGLCDKNRVEIYEGDVVECSRYQNEERHTVIIKDIRQLPSLLFGGNLNSRLVIGNIYENPEFLNEPWN